MHHAALLPTYKGTGLYGAHLTILGPKCPGSQNLQGGHSPCQVPGVEGCLLACCRRSREHPRASGSETIGALVFWLSPNEPTRGVERPDPGHRGAGAVIFSLPMALCRKGLPAGLSLRLQGSTAGIPVKPAGRFLSQKARQSGHSSAPHPIHLTGMVLCEPQSPLLQ